jgi:hypothetical protein
MPAARAVFGDEPGALERLLHEGIAEAHRVLAARNLVKVADVEALIVLPVQGEQSLHLGHRRTLGGGPATPAVVELVDAIPLELQPIAECCGHCGPGCRRPGSRSACPPRPAESRREPSWRAPPHPAHRPWPPPREPLLSLGRVGAVISCVKSGHITYPLHRSPSQLTLPGPHATVGEPEPRPARGSAR